MTKFYFMLLDLDLFQNECQIGLVQSNSLLKSTWRLQISASLRSRSPTGNHNW